MPYLRLSIAAAVVALLALPGLAAAIQNHAIHQKDKKFSEKKLTVQTGDSVTFRNDDSVKHNILVKDIEFNSGMQEPGQQATATFDSQGKFKVRCGIHPKMKLTVTVE